MYKKGFEAGIVVVVILFSLTVGLIIGLGMNHIDAKLDRYYSGDLSVEIVTNEIVIKDGVTNIDVEIREVGE